MCLAIPAKIVELGEEDTAKVDFGDGTTKEINITLVDPRVGDYVIVHAGFAIEVLDADEAEQTLDLWRELLDTVS